MVKRGSLLDTAVSVIAFATCLIMVSIATTLDDPMTMIIMLVLAVIVGSASMVTLGSLIKKKMNRRLEQRQLQQQNEALERQIIPNDLPPSYTECVSSGIGLEVVVDVSVTTLPQTDQITSEQIDGGNQPAVLEVVTIQDMRHYGARVNEGFVNDEEPPPSYEEALRLKELQTDSPRQNSVVSNYQQVADQQNYGQHVSDQQRNDQHVSDQQSNDQHVLDQQRDDQFVADQQRNDQHTIEEVEDRQTIEQIDDQYSNDQSHVRNITEHVDDQHISD
ncbi:uncharacterized protein [Ptychodera flava]|uniref:uncharacterized protein n=1 Tax=Ptychodera flava TaxID=63121 RepID=UPI00396A8EBA